MNQGFGNTFQDELVHNHHEFQKNIISGHLNEMSEINHNGTSTVCAKLSVI